jgi:hypothetical protein
MDLHFRKDEYVTSPGSLSQFLSHPYYRGRKSIEISIFKTIGMPFSFGINGHKN